MKNPTFSVQKSFISKQKKKIGMYKNNKLIHNITDISAHEKNKQQTKKTTHFQTVHTVINGMFNEQC